MLPGAAGAVSDGASGPDAAGAWSAARGRAERPRGPALTACVHQLLRCAARRSPGWALGFTPLRSATPRRQRLREPAQIQPAASSRLRRPLPALLRAVNSAPLRELAGCRPAPFPPPAAPAPSDWPPGSSQSSHSQGRAQTRAGWGPARGSKRRRRLGPAAPRLLSPALPLVEACGSVTFGRRESSPATGSVFGTRLRDPHNSALGQRLPASGFFFVPPKTREGPAWPPSESLLRHAR